MAGHFNFYFSDEVEADVLVCSPQNRSIFRQRFEQFRVEVDDSLDDESVIISANTELAKVDLMKNPDGFNSSSFRF